MKRPLLIVALTYVGGVATANFFEVRLTLLFGLSLVLASATLGWARTRPHLLWPLVFFAGWTNLATRTATLSPYDLRRIVGEQIEYVTLRGTLLETPTQRLYERDEKESWRSLSRMRVTELRRGTNNLPAFGSVAASTPRLLDASFFKGQTVEVTGVIRPPKGPAAEGLFNYRAYLGRHGIYHQLDVESTNDWQIVSAPTSPRGPPFSDRFRDWAQRTLARGLPLEDESLRLVWAMALGWKTALTDEVSEPFMRSGTMHIFAISGLHIALIAGILVNLLRVARIPRTACGWVVIPLLWFYTAATGWQPSAIRSTIMMSIVIGGWALSRPIDLLNSLAGAAIIILILDPQQLFQAGFQLSFFVVLSIALLLPPIEKVRQRLLRSDPLLPPELRPRWQRWFDLPIRLVTTSFVTSLAAWLGSLPLVAHYFHLLTPVSLLANVIIVPISSVTLMSNLGSLLCGDWFPLAGELFNHSGWFWMRLMVDASEWCASLPGAFFYVRSPTWFGFGIYYLLLFCTLTGWAFAPARRRWVAGAGAVIGLAWLVSSWPHRNDIHMTILSLQGGDSIFVDARGRANDLLIDCGDSSAAEFVVRPFLRGRGVNRLAALLLTHGDIRHTGGAAIIVPEFNARTVYANAARARSTAYQRLVERLETSTEHWRQVGRGDPVAGWTILHPAAEDRFTQADDNAIVLRREFHGTRVLLCSDLSKRGQRILLEREPQLRADIVVAGMPNLDEPLGDALLDAIQPRVIIISAGLYPSNELAPSELRERLNKRGVPVLFTSDVGAVTAAFKPGGWEVRTMKGSRYSSEPIDPAKASQ